MKPRRGLAGLAADPNLTGIVEGVETIDQLPSATGRCAPAAVSTGLQDPASSTCEVSSRSRDARG